MLKILQYMSDFGHLWKPHNNSVCTEKSSNCWSVTIYISLYGKRHPPSPTPHPNQLKMSLALRTLSEPVIVLNAFVADCCVWMEWLGLSRVLQPDWPTTSSLPPSASHHITCQPLYAKTHVSLIEMSQTTSNQCVHLKMKMKIYIKKKKEKKKNLFCTCITVDSYCKLSNHTSYFSITISCICY